MSSPSRTKLIDAEIREEFSDEHVAAIQRMIDGNCQVGDAQKFAEVMNFYLSERCLH